MTQNRKPPPARRTPASPLPRDSRSRGSLPAPAARRPACIGLPAFALLAALLVLPVWALSSLARSIDWRLLAAQPVVCSLVAFFLYRSDKRSAQAGERRIPEATLHFVELMGGWPGAFLAQRKFRHKTAKTSFQFVFWAIVFVHQLAAADFLMGWRIIRGALGCTFITF